jgi:RHS repeat-associated protein
VTKCSAENLQVSAQNRLTGYSYDAAGNMTGDGIHTATYDGENRLTQVSPGIASYLYDSEGNRVSKNAGGISTEYVYFGGNAIAERNPSAGNWTDYIFLNGKRVARRDPSGAVHYYLSDHLGSTTMVVNAAGAIENESDYYPWGGELKISATDSGNHYKFTGKERDAETGLDYFGARYYSNAMGRWISPDWAEKPEAVPYSDLHDPQSLNLYSYVRNIPTSKVDSDGHKVEYQPDRKKAKEANKRILKNLSPAERKLFRMAKNKDTGKYVLQIDNKAAANFKGQHTEAYERLSTGVGSEKKITVNIENTYNFGGFLQDIGRAFGGGITQPQSNGDVKVSLSSDGNTQNTPVGTVRGMNGDPVPDPPSMVAAHEVLGHAVEDVTGGDTSEHHVRQIENKMRSEQGLPLRDPDNN